MYGVWNSYKNCVEMTHKAFVAIAQFLVQGWERGASENGDALHEKTIAGLLLANVAHIAWLDSTTHALMDNYRELVDVLRVGLGCLLAKKAKLHSCYPVLLA